MKKTNWRTRLKEEEIALYCKIIELEGFLLKENFDGLDAVDVFLLNTQRQSMRLYHSILKFRMEKSLSPKENDEQ